MLRVNLSFLNFIQDLFDKKREGDGIGLSSFKPAEFLMKQGEAVRDVYVVKTGICKVFFEEENGKEYILEFLSTGEIVGELEIIRAEKSLCSVQAIGEVVAFKISKAYFLQLLNENLSLNKILIEAFAERITNTSTKASFQQLYSIDDTLKKVIAMQKENNLEISKADLSAYLGISIRSLNRSLKNLKENQA